MWPETRNAIREALADRPAPNDSGDAKLAFLTRFGRRWVRTNKSGTPDDAIGKELAKLLKGLGLKRDRVSFYALRHGCQTIGGNSRDPDAVSHIMGHIDTSMADNYRERIDDDRLQAVVDVVHAWLFEEEDDDKVRG